MKLCWGERILIQQGEPGGFWGGQKRKLSCVENWRVYNAKGGGANILRKGKKAGGVRGWQFKLEGEKAT